MGMFCFQCEQTAGCKGCMGKAGVCGKKEDTAILQDQLTGALIGLAHAATGHDAKVDEKTHRLVMEGLFATITNVNFNNESLRKLVDRVHAEKIRVAPVCSGCASPCGRSNDYDMNLLWTEQEDVRSLKSLILFGIRGVAAYAWHAAALGYTDEGVQNMLLNMLCMLGDEWGMEALIAAAMEVGKVNLRCMELLDEANTGAYGTPSPTKVTMKVEKGPFIVISGHDLYDLKRLLEQTEGKGVNVYTHGEMLPAHGYPQLKKYAHLK